MSYFQCSVLYLTSRSLSSHYCTRSSLHTSFQLFSYHSLTLRPQTVSFKLCICLHVFLNFIAPPPCKTVVCKPFPHYIPPDHAWIGNQGQIKFWITHESGAWTDTGSYGDTPLNTLANTFLNTHQYDITVTSPLVSILFSTILFTESPSSKRYDRIATSVPGRSFSSSNLHSFQPVYPFYFPVIVSRYILQFHYIQLFRGHLHYVG